jgi:hypothetical protein
MSVVLNLTFMIKIMNFMIDFDTFFDHFLRLESTGKEQFNVQKRKNKQ